jgi:hypothetical protein
MTIVTERHVNGARRRLDAEAGRSLLNVLRDDLDLTGCKFERIRGCYRGLRLVDTMTYGYRPLHEPRMRSSPSRASWCRRDSPLQRRPCLLQLAPRCT